MENKRGAAMAMNTIIMIIIGVIVMVILIVGFYAGWGTLAPWLSSENVDTIIGSCQTACSTQSTFSYCSKVKELNTGEQEIEASCYALQKVEEFNDFGLEPCSVKCDKTCDQLVVKVDGKVQAIGADCKFAAAAPATPATP